MSHEKEREKEKDKQDKNKTTFLLSPDILHCRTKSTKYLRDSILAIKIQYRWNESRSRLVDRTPLFPREFPPRAYDLGRSVGDDNAKIAISISSGGSITFSAVYTFIHSVSGRSVIYAEVAGYHSRGKDSYKWRCSSAVLWSCGKIY